MFELVSLYLEAVCGLFALYLFPKLLDYCLKEEPEDTQKIKLLQKITTYLLLPLLLSLSLYMITLVDNIQLGFTRSDSTTGPFEIMESISSHIANKYAIPMLLITSISIFILILILIVLKMTSKSDIED